MNFHACHLPWGLLPVHESSCIILSSPDDEVVRFSTSFTTPEKHEGIKVRHIASKAALVVPKNSHPRKLFHVAWFPIWPPQLSMRGLLLSDVWEPARHIILFKGESTLTNTTSLYPLLTLLWKYLLSIFPKLLALFFLLLCTLFRQRSGYKLGFDRFGWRKGNGIVSAQAQRTSSLRKDQIQDAAIFPCVVASLSSHVSHPPSCSVSIWLLNEYGGTGIWVKAAGLVDWSTRRVSKQLVLLTGLKKSPKLLMMMMEGEDD